MNKHTKINRKLLATYKDIGMGAFCVYSLVFAIASSQLNVEDFSIDQLYARTGLWLVWFATCFWLMWDKNFCGVSNLILDSQAKSSARVKKFEEDLAASTREIEETIQRMNRESDERMAAFEAETQPFLEEHAQPIQPDDVLDRLYDIDPNATATREADGSLTIRLHPKLTATPK